MRRPFNIKGYFNGQEFTKYCIINEIRPLLHAPRTNTFLKNSLVSGSNFLRSSLDQIELEVDITIVHNVQANLDHLNRIFFANEPKELKFSDREDRYLMAILDGGVRFSNNHTAGKAKLKFTSSDYFWRSSEGMKTQPFKLGRAIVENEGTAPTQPIYDIHFKSDCGYVSVVGPKGFMTFGNQLETDQIELPSNEYPINDNPITASGWTQIKDAHRWIPDYEKISSNENAVFNGLGMNLNPNIGNTYEQWHGHAYIKEFAPGQVEKEADNFQLTSALKISNTQDPSRTCAMLVVVMDANNRPIMTTSIYDTGEGKNELTVTYKVPDPSDSKKSIIIRSGKLSALDGYIRMSKQGGSLSWEAYTDRTQYTVNQKVRVGQQAHIKRSCTHAETGHPILKGYHDLTYTIGAIKRGRDGTNAYRFDNGGWPIYWIYERDIEEVRNYHVSRSPQSFKHSAYSPTAKDLRASKVFVWQGKWGGSKVYDQFSIRTMLVKRIYAESIRDVKNVFTTGDHLYVDTKTGDVLLNGSTAKSLLDVDSRFFPLDFGSTELGITYSDWAKMPDVSISYESRWLS